MKFDLHVHTTLSPDSELTLSSLVSAAKSAGLSGVAVCDHNAFGNLKGTDDIYIIPACEVSTDAGHILVYFLKSDICKNLKKTAAGVYKWQDVIEYAHKEGAITFLAHPFSPKVFREDDFWKKIDGVEVFNSRVVHSKIRSANKNALSLCKKLGLPFSAGSDAHSEKEVGKAFWECSLSENEILSPDFEEKLKLELLSAQGKVFCGFSPISVVLSCKRRIYIKRKDCKKLIRSFLLQIYLFLRNMIKGKEKQSYIDIHTEEKE